MADRWVTFSPGSVFTRAAGEVQRNMHAAGFTLDEAAMFRRALNVLTEFLTVDEAELLVRYYQAEVDRTPSDVARMMLDSAKGSLVLAQMVKAVA
jgi:hypothetical protein